MLKSRPAVRALYNNLKASVATGAFVVRSAETLTEYTATGDSVLDLALMLDVAVRSARPDAWRGVHAKEQVIKAALYTVLQDRDEVERLFQIVKAQGEY